MEARRERVDMDLKNHRPKISLSAIFETQFIDFPLSLSAKLFARLLSVVFLLIRLLWALTEWRKKTLGPLFCSVFVRLFAETVRFNPWKALVK